MKYSLGLFMLLVIGGVQAYAVDPPKKPAIAPIKDFLIDPSKPYVYFKVDHIGPRTPGSDDEPATGIYLKLVNNCRLSIIVDTFGTSQGAADDESGVQDWVVLNPTGYGDGGVEVTAGVPMPAPSLRNMPDEILSPKKKPMPEHWPNGQRATTGRSVPL
jgi:hypothetical protein